VIASGKYTRLVPRFTAGDVITSWSTPYNFVNKTKITRVPCMNEVIIGSALSLAAAAASIASVTLALV
jgi:hypothetical protein